MILLLSSALLMICGISMMIRGMKEEQTTRRERTPGLTHLDPP